MSRQVELTRRKLSYHRRYLGISWILAILFASLACSAAVPEIPAPEAGADASVWDDDAGAAPVDSTPYDATLPWYGPDPAGNEPPHRIR